MGEVLAGVLLSAVAAYLAVVVYTYLGQASKVYLPDLPSRELGASPADIGLSFDDVWLHTDDGLRLHAWYVPAQGERAALLYFHGNSGNISQRLDSVRIFHDLRLSVLLFDYRGCGRSEGRPTEEGTHRDALAAWAYLAQQRRVASQRLVILGRSLGASMAAWLATQRPAAALVVESTSTSAPNLAAEFFWWLPARRLTRFRYATRDYLAAVRCPVLVAHSPEDEIIPYRHGEALFAAAPEPKQLLRLRGSHEDGFMLSGEDYVRGLDGFLSRHLSAAGQ
jgi:pimeloyl-ACP methyl ester carboxylesterase